MIELVVDIQNCLQVHFVLRVMLLIIYFQCYVLCSDIYFDYHLQAFVGVAEDLNSIVIAFRGTQENR